MSDLWEENGLFTDWGILLQSFVFQRERNLCWDFIQKHYQVLMLWLLASPKLGPHFSALRQTSLQQGAENITENVS